MRPFGLILLSTAALVAQAPTAKGNERLAALVAEVKQLQKNLKFKEALAKAEAVLPAAAPSFPDNDLKGIGESLDKTEEMLFLLDLNASAASESGDWEKALSLQERRLQVAQAAKASLLKAQAPVAATWEKAAKEAREYVAAQTPRLAELGPKVAAFRKEFEALKADVQAGKRKLTAKERDEWNAKAQANEAEAQDLEVIPANLKVYRDNIEKSKTVKGMLDKNVADADKFIKAAREAVERKKDSIKLQTDEITTFNTQQTIKKVKLVGKKNWVDAVVNTKENFTKLPDTEAKAAFLNRLLVVDPGNEKARKALEALEQGKDPFAADPKPAKKAGSKKK